MEHYRHTQIGTTLIVSYLIVLLGIGIFTYKSDFSPAGVIALIIVLLVLAIFASLTVQVDISVLRIQFGIGLVRKSFQLDDVRQYRAVQNPWYYFLGIRYTPRGWLFAVSGFSAVELEMKNGKLYRIGTDEPEKLIQALDDVFGRQKS